jgi:hypothetical protein
MNEVMKYKFTGTPGLWDTIGTLDFIDGPEGHNISDEGRHSICQVFGPDAKANQMLISAAPLLLSALIKVVEAVDIVIEDTERFNFPSSPPEWYAQAKSAIEAALNLKTVQP